MGVYNGPDVRSIPVDDQVHAELRRWFFAVATGQHRAVERKFDDIFGLHHALANSARRNQEFVIVEPDGDVAIVAGHQKEIVQALPSLADLLAEIPFIAHCGTHMTFLCW